MLEAPPPRLEIGDFAPATALVDTERKQRTLYQQGIAGQPIVLFLCRRLTRAAVTAEIERYRDLHDRFAALGVRLLAVSGEAPADNLAAMAARRLPFPVLADPLGRFLAAAGLPEDERACASLVFDANLRLQAALSGGGKARQAARAMPICRGLAEATTPMLVQAQAPVLLIPQIFDAAFCRDLIAAWHGGEKRVNETSYGVAGTSDHVARNDSDTKRRSDVLIPDGANPLNLKVRDLLLRRVAPEIRKSFQYKVKSYEIARLGCYDAAAGGYFRAHRDDMGDPAKPRQFALSVNLNDDFEGGALCFPEYGRPLYRPAPGGGVVFSCNLLHEAMPVTSGRRFGLFTFFH